MHVAIEDRMQGGNDRVAHSVAIHQRNHLFRRVVAELHERVVPECGVDIDDHAFLRSSSFQALRQKMSSRCSEVRSAERILPTLPSMEESVAKSIR